MEIFDYEKVLERFQPEIFLRSDQNVACKALKLLKGLYDFTKDESSNSERENKKSKLSSTETPLQNLIVANFDEDQIWEEIQLQNESVYESLVSSLANSVANYRKSAAVEEFIEDEEESELEEDEQDDGDDDDDEEGEEESDDDELEFEGKEKKNKKSSLRIKTNYAKSEVDDKFFNLAQMTEFLEQQENESKKEDDEDEDIDLFEESDEEKETEEEKDDDGYYFKDFFDQPLDEEEQEEEEEEINQNTKEVRFNLPENDENFEEQSTLPGGGEEEDEELSENENIAQVLSNFEKSQKKIKENIEMIEDNVMQPKNWQLKGEVTAELRPENSLLEEHLVFDHLIRQAPEITLQTTHKLEDIIRQRVKDQAWDDVERKAKTIEDPSEFKKRLLLNSEKSQKSLSQIYEEEYINKTKKEDNEIEETEDVDLTPEEHLKIQKEMHNLFIKLDALSNFHFTPKMASTEIKIVSNMPSITMEEVAPVGTSDGAMLAPQEIEEHVKGEIKGRSERTETDRKRERRHKKKIQKLKKNAKDEKLKKLGFSKAQILENDKQKSSKKKLKEGEGKEEKAGFNKEVKSSTAFFTKLQEQVQTHIVKKGIKKKLQKSEEKKSAKRFKL